MLFFVFFVKKTCGILKSDFSACGKSLCLFAGFRVMFIEIDTLWREDVQIFIILGNIYIMARIKEGTCVFIQALSVLT